MRMLNPSLRNSSPSSSISIETHSSRGASRKSSMSSPPVTATRRCLPSMVTYRTMMSTLVLVGIVSILATSFVLHKYHQQRHWHRRFSNHTIYSECFQPYASHRSSPSQKMLTFDEVSQLSTESHFEDIATPRVVHLVRMSSALPYRYAVLLRNCIQLNPNVKFLLWTGSLVARFLEWHLAQHRNDSFAAAILLRFKEPHNQNREEIEALAKIVLIYYVGGVALDADMECRRHSLQEILRQIASKQLCSALCLLNRANVVWSRVVWNRDFILDTSFMACQAGHPFFAEVLRQSLLNPKRVFGHNGVASESFSLTRYFMDFYHRQPSPIKLHFSGEDDESTLRKSSRQCQDHVLVSDPTWFSTNAKIVPFLQKRCQALNTSGVLSSREVAGSWTKQGCESDQLSRYADAVHGLTANSFLIPHYLHLDHMSNLAPVDYITNRVDLCLENSDNFFIVSTATHTSIVSDRT